MSFDNAEFETKPKPNMIPLTDQQLRTFASQNESEIGVNFESSSSKCRKLCHKKRLFQIALALIFVALVDGLGYDVYKIHREVKTWKLDFDSKKQSSRYFPHNSTKGTQNKRFNLLSTN